MVALVGLQCAESLSLAEKNFGAIIYVPHVRRLVAAL
jgi:hypothetical protein